MRAPLLATQWCKYDWSVKQRFNVKSVPLVFLRLDYCIRQALRRHDSYLMSASVSSIDLNNLSPIQVFVRIKPDDSNVHDEVVPFKYNGRNKIRISSDSPSLSFDRVFPPESTQCDVFECMIPLLHLPLYGYHSTVFAYGQTNSGKTYTMLGPDGKLSLAADSMGVVPRASRYLFAAIHKLTSASSSTISSACELLGSI